jgi:hypothetical protein
MKRIKFTALKANGEENITAIMECDGNPKILGGAMFLKALKKAIKEWTCTEKGAKVLSDTDYNFNFGDLFIHAENADLQRLMERHFIFNFTMGITSNDNVNFDYDLVLAD